MMKNSIKRGQSQAGLSFAERENRRSLAGGESNFRPQVKNKLLLLLALLMTAATGAWAQTVVTIGNGTDNTAFVPYNSSYKNSLQEQIYLASEIGQSGIITAISFNIVDQEDDVTNSVDVYMKNVTRSSFSSTTDYEPLAASDMVFSGSVNYKNNGWNTITLDTPFEYDNTKNLLICLSKKGSTSYSIYNYYTTQTENRTIAFYNDTDAPDPYNLGSYSKSIKVSTTRANIKITMEDLPAPTYKVTMKDGVKDADKWTITPNEGLKEGDAVTLTYSGRLKVKGVKATSDAAPAAPAYNETKSINDGPVTVAAGEHWLITGTGTQTTNTMSIGAGATVTLDGVNISSGGYCIKCAGDATIILKEGSTNTLTGTGDEYPALSIGDANTTLTIQGSTGVLNVTSGDYCAGIGGGYSNTNSTCGNIRIEGGVITAQGGNYGAGIGTDAGKATCGDITIMGGTITAKGGTHAAGIGTGEGDSFTAVCGNITIANTVTKVTATKGADAPYSIGKGYGSIASCGTITIGGTVYWQDNAAVGDGATYLAQATIVYPAPAVKPVATLTEAPKPCDEYYVGDELLESLGEAEGGTLMYKLTTTNVKPTSTEGFSTENPKGVENPPSYKNYIWYYIKGDDTHSDSEIFGPIELDVWDS